MNKVGTVHTILENGDVRVKFQGNKTWTLNPAAVTKLVQFSKGDVIKVIDDMPTVYTLQENHGGWVDDMALVRERRERERGGERERERDGGKEREGGRERWRKREN